MSFPLILNSSNYVNGNTYRIDLPTMMDLNSFECSLGYLQLYYSWFNISPELGNQQFSLTMPSNGILNITIPPGAYQISDLNNLIQYQLIQAGYYITNTTSGLNTYYCTLQVSPTDYSVQFITNSLPTSLPAGFVSGGMVFPASANQHMQITILSTNNFKDIVGYLPGTYPSVPTNIGNQTKSSDYTPNVSPISAVQMRVSCLSNPFSSNNQLLHLFTSEGASIGQSISSSPNFAQFVSCSGTHQSITVSFFDQLGRFINIIDKNLVVKLVFRKKSE